MAKKKKSHRRRGMHGLGKINFAANLKNALTKKEVIDDLTGLWAIVPYLGIATVFGMQGYLAWAVSFLGAWATGAILKKPAISRAAFGIAVTHFIMAQFTPFFQDKLKMPLWRMGSYQFATGNPASQGQGSLAAYIPDSNVNTFFNPGNSLVPAGVSDYVDDASASKMLESNVPAFDELSIQNENFV